MSDPSIAGAVTFFLSFLLLVTAIFIWGPFWESHSKFAKRYLLPAHVLLFVTSWLWIPWISYGTRSVYAWNVGKINDLEFPVQVLPPTPVVRPSAADGVEK